MALVAAAAGPATAQEAAQRVAPETVVTASRIAIPAAQVGSAVTVITGEDLERQQTVLVADILRTVPGLAVSRAGPVGNTTQVRIRGAEANQTLVLIDGVEVADPTISEFNFAHLLAADVDRIEIVRGPQSALWGADAIGGVINIITKRGRKGYQAEASAEGGSFGTWQSSGSLRGGGERWNGAFSATYFETEGTNMSRFGNERDGAENFTLSTNGAVDVTDNLEIGLTGRYIDSDNEFDPQDFAVPPTPTSGLVIDGDEVQKTRHLFGRTYATLSLLEDHWENTVSVSGSDVRKKFISDGVRTSRNDGQRTKVDYQSTLRFDTPEVADAAHTAIFLVEREDERFENQGATADAPENQKQDRDAVGLVGEYRVDLWDRLFLSAALRHDFNSDFEDATTWRTTGAYILPWTESRLHASYATGVTNPTFFEQFGFFPDSFAGNPNLRPEESRSWDVGIEQPFLDDRVVLDVTYFHADLRDEIVTVFDPDTFLLTVENQDGRSRRHGVEVSLRAEPWSGLTLNAAYTFTDATDPDSRQEIRRPKHVASFDASQRFWEDRASFGVGVQYNGNQQDSEFVPTTPNDRVELDSFTLVNVYGSYRISDNVEAFARVENLLDEDYEEVFSYVSPGIGAYAGIKLTFGSGS